MKKILFSSAVLSLILMSCSSTKVATKADAGTYINTITAPELSKHLYIVAGDEMQGRNTGEEGQKKAGKYLIDEYKNGHQFSLQEQLIFIKKCLLNS